MAKAASQVVTLATARVELLVPFIEAPVAWLQASAPLEVGGRPIRACCAELAQVQGRGEVPLPGRRHERGGGCTWRSISGRFSAPGRLRHREVWMTPIPATCTSLARALKSAGIIFPRTCLLIINLALVLSGPFRRVMVVSSHSWLKCLEGILSVGRSGCGACCTVVPTIVPR